MLKDFAYARVRTMRPADGPSINKNVLLVEESSIIRPNL
jgi:hypothetical protein